MNIGILALQGAYQQQARILGMLGVDYRFIRLPKELDDCDGLILPGGESTVMAELADSYGFRQPLSDFGRYRPVMGTCAGAILMAEQVDDRRVSPLGLMPLHALRNNYGSQVDSFSTVLELAGEVGGGTYTAHFIRAPALEAAEDACVLASYQGRPVLVRYERHLAMSFHPELTNDSRIHEYWLSLIQEDR